MLLLYAIVDNALNLIVPEGWELWILSLCLGCFPASLDVHGRLTIFTITSTAMCCGWLFCLFFFFLDADANGWNEFCHGVGPLPKWFTCNITGSGDWNYRYHWSKHACQRTGYIQIFYQKSHALWTESGKVVIEDIHLFNIYKLNALEFFNAFDA